jgi:RNA polymerase sigma-70 factor (ECF subfamily)
VTTRHSSERERTLEEVYRANYPQLLAYAQKLTLGDRAQAEDIAQETMVRAWEHIDELDLDRSVARPWLFTVARRVAIDGLRARASRPAEIGGDLLTLHATGKDSIDQTITALDLGSALSALSPDHRAVLEYLYLRGRTSEETAALMGIPTGTVKSRRFHALRAVRRAMARAASRVQAPARLSRLNQARAA